MMMALGQFVFAVGTAAYQELQRQTAWRHPATSRVGARPVRQFLGPGDDTVNLSGVVAPELTGTAAAIGALRDMGAEGARLPLVDGNGIVHGEFVIESLNETQTILMRDGTPRRIEFQLQLARVDDARADQPGRSLDALAVDG